ncbi:MAG: hypothetical protein JRI96_18785 [Deltaproteobacteria bacterium]|nr:hypothetical protein [Deltaproteobacteria bacterium]
MELIPVPKKPGSLCEPQCFSNDTAQKNLLIGIFLALITLACYWNAQHLGFVNLDDGQYVTQNPGPLLSTAQATGTH